MNSWIDHAQRFICSGLNDHSLWEDAKNTCQNPQIRDFLSAWPLKDEDDVKQADIFAESLDRDGQAAPALMVHLLIRFPILLKLETPLKISNDQHEIMFSFTATLIGKMRRHHELLPSLALLQYMRGTGWSELKSYAAAYKAFEEALSVFRKLADDQQATYLPNVAMTLNNFGNLLRDRHDFDRAKMAYDDALDIRRKLANKKPSIYQRDVAMTLNNRGALLIDKREFQAARIDFNEALDIYRQLVKVEDERDKYLTSLAMTLTNLGNLQRDVNEFQSARSTYEEALEIRRLLAADKSATNQYLLAITLISCGAMLCDVRDFKAAREVLDEALNIFCQYVEEHPAFYLPGKAMALNNLGNLLSDVRDFQGARRAYEEAFDIRRQLANDNPDAYLPDVAMSLNNLGGLLRDFRDYTAAHTAFNRVVEIYRRLDEDQHTFYLSDLAMSLNNLGVVLRHNQDFMAAQMALDEALLIYQQLATNQKATYLPDVATVLTNLGTVLHDNRDYPAARTAYEKGLNIRRQLAKDHSAAYLDEVAITLNNLGNLLQDMREFPAARIAYVEAVDLAETLHYSKNLQHLSKQLVTGAYQYLLKMAVSSCSVEKAFAYSVAMRDGQACSNKIGRNELQETIDWLTDQSEQSGIIHQLIVACNGPDNQLILGLIDQTDCNFVLLDGEKWKALSPGYEVIHNHQKRYLLAREIWKSLPDLFQDAFKPELNRKKVIAISADPFWNAFPWELLRFGEGDEDYVGLHHALPRIGAIQVRDLQSQFSITELGQHGGQLAVIAPFDTGLYPLSGIVDEIYSVKKAVEKRGGEVVAFAEGTKASDLEIDRQISLQPDILYYSGHGTIFQDEEMLVLHRDMSSHNTMSSTVLFGKEHLLHLAEQRSGLLFPQHPLVVLNSCLTGRVRQAGGVREDLISTFLALGAGAVIATAIPIYDVIGKALGEALFEPTSTQEHDISSFVVETRKCLAMGLCADVESPFWGAWGMIHLHGSALAACSINMSPRELL
ncbi:MAG: CHAT domain-containing protein [Candidatus Thiodiazotropha sp. (ex Troendleina suluensis)]|nr:CHAT domain-containing protein [Candidatus Thiodiazotropha sp. (ex Troendleina suluensis)]